MALHLQADTEANLKARCLPSGRWRGRCLLRVLLLVLAQAVSRGAVPPSPPEPTEDRASFHTPPSLFPALPVCRKIRG